KWIENYLTGRTQQVRLNDTLSPPVNVTSSVPQGTCLGPLLFIIYVNDLPKVVKNSSVFLFADDCKISFRYNRNTNSDGLQRDLDAVYAWSNSMQLSLSIEKCAILRIGNHSDDIVRKYHIGNTELEICASIRDLGIFVDSKLNFSAHCST